MGLGFINLFGSPFQAQGPNLTASAARTSLTPTAGKQTLPTQFFDRPGKMIHVWIAGRLSNIVATPGTLTLDLTLSAVQVWNSGAIQLSSTAHTTLPFWLDIYLTLRAIGSGTNANLMAAGRMTSQAIMATAVADSTNTHTTLMVPNVTPVVSTGFDSTILNAVDIFGTFSLNNANAIAIEQGFIKEMN